MAGYTKEESHRIALERIDEVERSGKTKLKLNLLGLTTIPLEITKLSNLTHLNLDGNSLISLPAEIKNLTNLTTLEIPYNHFDTLPAGIAELKNLKKLYLDGNSLTVFPSEILQLPNLVELDISGNKIMDLPPEIGKLSNLVRLCVMSNPISYLPAELFHLTNLEELILAGLSIKTVSQDICLLKNLVKLDLTANQLPELPLSILKLKKLKELILDGNRFTSLPEGIGLLTKLTKLSLSYNQFTFLPPEIGALENLEFLWADSNKLFALPEEIANLKKLRELSLSKNRFTAFPNVVTKLEALEELDFSSSRRRDNNVSKENVPENKITKLPDSLSRLQHLKRLRIDGNAIYTLPSALIEIRSLQQLYLRENPLPIPPEILDSYDQPEFLLKYFFSKVKKKINEAKLLIIGQGSVGKTSLVDQILFGTFDHNRKKTEGISINQWKLAGFEKQGADSEIKTNIWDFGGQEIMHATHQFFLTKRSLYLLVLDSRLTQEENRVEYWLKIIQSFGGESPVLIVGNKIDQHPLDIDRTGLQKKYPNIVGILETSAATGAGIEELKAAIAEQVNRLPHVRDLLPETWFTVKTKLEGLGRESNFINQDDYVKLCAASEVTDEISQRTLIGFLHDLGVVLYFQDDPRLEALGILNPQWVTNGVYKILNSHTLFQNKGVLTVSMLDEILNLPEYPRGKRLFIVDMMKKFELCYDIDGDTFLVPDLLPKDEPYTGEWDGVLAFKYDYGVLPSSIMSRFIVKMKDFVHQPSTWRSGTILMKDGNTAFVKADFEDKTVTIKVQGSPNTRRDMLSLIRGAFEMIHKSVSRLEVTQQVQHPQYPNLILDYEELIEFEREGVEDFPRKVDGKVIKVNVREMLNGIESENQRKEKTVINYNYFGDINTSGDFIGRDKNISAGDNSVAVGGNVLDSRISANYNKFNFAGIDPELREIMNQLAEAVDDMIQKLPAEQAAEVAEDFGKLADEVVKPKPNQRWYSVSIGGLIKAAENLDKLGEPVISLSRKVLSLLTGGAIKQ